MVNNNFREELRIKYLKLLMEKEEIDAFISYFDESESYINQIIASKTVPKKTTLEDIIEVIKYRKAITLKQKI